MRGTTFKPAAARCRTEVAVRNGSALRIPQAPGDGDISFVVLGCQSKVALVVEGGAELRVDHRQRRQVRAANVQRGQERRDGSRPVPGCKKLN